MIGSNPPSPTLWSCERSRDRIWRVSHNKNRNTRAFPRIKMLPLWTSQWAPSGSLKRSAPRISEAKIKLPKLGPFPPPFVEFDRSIRPSCLLTPHIFQRLRIKSQIKKADFGILIVDPMTRRIIRWTVESGCERKTLKGHG